MKAEDSEEFILFWQAYPRKVAKGHARRAFAKAIQIVALESILAALESQKHNRSQMSTAGMFVPEWKHPATWLNAECWSDELRPIEQTSRRLTFDDHARMLQDSIKNSDKLLE